MTTTSRRAALLTFLALLIVVLGASLERASAQKTAPVVSPVLTVLPSAGVGATATLAPGSTDDAGQITLTTGTGFDDTSGTVRLSFPDRPGLTAIGTVIAADEPTANSIFSRAAAWVQPGTAEITIGLPGATDSVTVTFTYLARSL